MSDQTPTPAPTPVAAPGTMPKLRVFSEITRFTREARLQFATILQSFGEWLLPQLPGTTEDQPVQARVVNTPTVTVGNWPDVQAISGKVAVVGQPDVFTVTVSPADLAKIGPLDIQPVSGTVKADIDFPDIQPVSGKVDIGNLPQTQQIAGRVTADVTFPATQVVSGTVDASGSKVSITNLPTTQAVSGRVTADVAFPATQAVTLPAETVTKLTPPTSVSISNLPSTQQVSGRVTADVAFPATQPVSGTVSVTGSTVGLDATALAALNAAKTLATQPVSGTVAVSGTVPVSGTFWQAVQPISGTVTANVAFPATQAVSGTVSVSGSSVSVTNLPQTQAVSGRVTADVTFPATQAVSGNFWPTTQPVSGTVGVSGTVPVTGDFYPATQVVSGSVTVKPADPVFFTEATWSGTTGRSTARATGVARRFSWSLTLAGGLSLGSMTLQVVGSEDGTTWYPLTATTTLATGATTSGETAVLAPFMALQLSTTGVLLNLTSGVTKAKTGLYYN